MIDIRTELSPLRMVLARRNPVELMVELNNNTNKTQMITLTIDLGNQLAFDKGGRTSIQTKHIDKFQPGEHMRDYYNIYPRPVTDQGEHALVITIDEHYNNSYQYVQSKKSKELVLRVE